VTTSSHQFLSLRCDVLRTDLGFYKIMKQEYNKARGWLRLYFSMWQYDHCEFVRFKKYGYQRGARLKVAFPEQDDLEYDFIPRVPNPAPPDGPVSSDEFRDHYYLPDCLSFHSWRRYQLRFRGHFNKITREDLEALPKRHTQVDMDDGLSELFYGLYAKERRSFARVAAYACLCNLPGVAFFFLWLFRWGHGADLQNASVPLTLSLSLTLGFAAVVFGTRDGG